MNLLITGAWQQAQDYLDNIRSMGHQTLFLQHETDMLPCDSAWVEGVICNGLFLYHPIEQFQNLRFIQLTSAGYDRVPMDYVQAHSIEIHNARGVYSVPMAEFAIAGVLNLYKKLGQFRDRQREHHWEKDRGLLELAGQTVVIVGCGSVGTECAKRFKAFDCRVLGIDIAVYEDEHYDQMLPLNDLDNALSQADVVVLTVPLTETTYHLIDVRRLAIIHGVLVNIARGAVVDQQALVAWNGMAVLDVFEDEPLSSESQLWEKREISVFPHNSFIGNNNNMRLTKLVMSNLSKY